MCQKSMNNDTTSKDDEGRFLVDHYGRILHFNNIPMNNHVSMTVINSRDDLLKELP